MGVALAASADELFSAAHAALADVQPARAERLLRRAVHILDGVPSESGLTAERVLLSLAYVRAERGNVSEGDALLDQVASRIGSWHGSLREELEGLLASQRALLRMRSGDLSGGLALLDQAAPRLAGLPTELIRLLLNRGALRLYLGRLAEARADFVAVTGLAEQLGRPLDGLKARHNLGYLAFLGGDLPRSLAEMDQVKVGMVGAAPDVMAVVHLDHARVRYAAGLLGEADQDLDEAIHHFARQRNRQDQAECELAKAQVALTAGRDHEAHDCARTARRRFESRGSRAWALVAQLTELRARLALRSGLPAAARDAEALARALRDAGILEDARMAQLVAVRARVALREVDQAVDLIGKTFSHVRRDGIVTRLYAHRTRAELAAATGNSAAANRQLRAGLRELQRYQASFGSLDLQTAVVRHGRALAAMGLRMAVEQGTPSTVFAWSERARATASRLPPVRPPDDPEAARLLEELRYVRTEQRTSELSGRDDPALRQRRSELERLVRQRSWYAAGAGDVEEPVTMARLRRVLAATPGATFVAHMVVGADVHALVVTGRQSTVVALGPVDDALQRIRRLRADLDALALRNVPEPIRRSVSSSVARGLDGLQERLWLPLQGLAGDGPVLLVPSGPLVAAAWTMLPALAGRPVTLARSATAWVRAHEALVPLAADTTQVVLAAGPDLARADEEVREIGSLWAGATSFTGGDARGAPLLAAADGADVVHLAAHGVHEAANPLFSALRLADGPLFGYDLARMHVAPRLVVLSACELGQVTERPGDEVVGMTAALLHQGVGAVVASVAKVSDDVAFEVTLALHQRLRLGDSPSLALATSTENQPCAPFVVFGAGW